MQDVSCDFRDFCHIGDLLSSVILFGSRFVCLKHKLKWFLGVFLSSQFFLCFTVRFCAVRIYVDVIKMLSVTQNSRSVLCIHYRRFVFKEKNKICRPEQFFSVAMGITTKTKHYFFQTNFFLYLLISWYIQYGQHFAQNIFP